MEENSIVRDIFRYLPLFILVFIAMTIVGWITRNGPGMSGDSVWYQMGAENILAGNGYMRFSGGGELRPITHFPPFYSLFLAGLGLIGPDLISIARWLNIVLLGLNIIFTWMIIRNASGSWILADLGAAFLVVNLATLKYYSWFMTEPLYSSLSLICLFVLLRFIRNKRLPSLLLAAILAGLAAITRLVGFGLILGCCGFLFFYQHEHLRQRLTRGIVFFAVSVSPSIIWLIYTSSVGEGTFNRSIIYHPMSIVLIKDYFLFLGDWIQVHRLLPGEYRLILAVVIVIAGPMLFLVKRFRDWFTSHIKFFQDQDSAIWLLMFYSISYVGALFMNSTFIDASTTTYAPERYLTAIYPVIVMLILLTYHRVWKWSKQIMSLAAALFLLAAGIITLQARVAWSEIAREAIPLGYTEFINDHQQFVSFVRESIKSHTIYSNNPELTFAISGKGAYILPYRFDSASEQENPGFILDIEALKDALAKGAQIIHYGEKDEQESQIYALLDLQVIVSRPEGEIYKAQ